MKQRQTCLIDNCLPQLQILHFFAPGKVTAKIGMRNKHVAQHFSSKLNLDKVKYCSSLFYPVNKIILRSYKEPKLSFQDPVMNVTSLLATKPMQDLLKHLPAVLYEYVIHPDRTKHFTYISEASESILGVSAQEVMNDAGVMDSLIHEEDFSSLRETSAVSQIEGREWYWHGRMIIRGEERWMEIRSNHEERGDGTIIRRGVIQDITERKESVKESEIRYQSLVERLPIGIVIHNHGKPGKSP